MSDAADRPETLRTEERLLVPEYGCVEWRREGARWRGVRPWHGEAGSFKKLGSAEERS